MAGEIKAQMADEYLNGVLDANGDQVPELLTTQTSGAGVPARGTIMVRTLRGGRLSPRWRCENASWQTWEPPLPHNVNSGATDARRDVMARPSPRGATVVIQQSAEGSPDETLLCTATWREGGFQFDTTVRGRRLEAVGLDAAGALLARCATGAGETQRVTATKGRAQPLLQQCPWGPLSTPVVAWETGQERPTLVVQDAGEELVALQAPVGEVPAKELWRLTGHAQTTSWPGESKGPVLADLIGDGRRQVIYATAAPSGCARLVASSLAPQEIWHHDFPTIPGTPPVWNTGGIILWQCGHFTDPRAMDVLVTVRRSMMHSEETYLLSGREGRELWHRNRQVGNRGVGGTPFAIADFDRDGLEDAASFHPSLVYVLKGTTGQDIIARDATWEAVPAKPVYWGLPIAGDFEHNGTASLFFGTERSSMTGLVRRDGSLAWWDALDKSPKSLPAFGDFDGDGRLEAIALGYEDGVRCYDTASGQVKWRMPPPVAGTPAGAASGDVNSDGRDEALFSIGQTLCCLGVAAGGNSGALLWKMDFPSPIGPPTPADVDDRGKVSVVLVSAQRYVYCVR
jgi:hypothetical protein